MKKEDYFVLGVALFLISLTLTTWIQIPVAFAGGWFIGCMFTREKK